MNLILLVSLDTIQQKRKKPIKSVKSVDQRTKLRKLIAQIRKDKEIKMPKTNTDPSPKVPFLPKILNNLVINELNKTELIYKIKGTNAT